MQKRLPALDQLSNPLMSFLWLPLANQSSTGQHVNATGDIRVRLSITGVTDRTPTLPLDRWNIQTQLPNHQCCSCCSVTPGLHLRTPECSWLLSCSRNRISADRATPPCRLQSDDHQPWTNFRTRSCASFGSDLVSPSARWSLVFTGKTATRPSRTAFQNQCQRWLQNRVLWVVR